MADEKTEGVTEIDADVPDDQALDVLRKETPEPTPEPKEEIKEEIKVEVKEEKKYVPYDALHEERMKRKELKAQLDKQEQRFQELVQKITPKEAPPEFANDTERLAYQQQQLEKKLEAQDRFVGEQKKAQEQYQQTQSLVNMYAAKAEEYSKTQPDFNDAYKFLLEGRKNEYLAVGYTPEQVLQFIQADELAIVQKAFQDEADPAERIYKIAKARGYVPKKPEAKLESIEKGMKQSKTLSGVPGSSPKGLTLEAIADMSDEEFSKLDYNEIKRIASQ